MSLNPTSSLTTLKKRADFLRLSKNGKKFATPVFLLLVDVQKEAEMPPSMRVGYTVTKKIGNAVVRNRVKRRFREAVKQVFPDHAKSGFDYVLIARNQAVEVEFTALIESLRFALSHLHKAGKPHRTTQPVSDHHNRQERTKTNDSPRT